eukprot:GHVO01010028.1.p2 GENE.GHVO01010028.1~~GHVO01010028.1.p2  ORF type:complete len:119 (+),score=32.44 GHVO01010028.1:519-875(+)
MSQTSLAAINARACRVSLGSLFHINIYRALSVPDALTDLKGMGIHVIGTSPNATQALKPPPPGVRWALLLGNEEEGASIDNLNSCTETVTIPQVRGDSLSVQHAAAICIYELSKSPHP